MALFWHLMVNVWQEIDVTLTLANAYDQVVLIYRGKEFTDASRSYPYINAGYDGYRSHSGDYVGTFELRNCEKIVLKPLYKATRQHTRSTFTTALRAD